MKIRMPAKKLANADVHFLSLVERGANRTPFKIQKRDKSMINLSFMTKKQEDKPQASIVAYVVMKEDRDAGYETALKAAGVKVDNVFEDGEVVLYRQDDSALKNEKDEVADGLIPVKLSPDFAVVLKGFDPYSTVGETSFTENLKTQGFMPSFSMAAQALVASINNTMTAAGDGKEAAAKVGEALDEFGDYVHGLVTEIPSQAFKSLEAFQAAKGEVLKLAEGMSDEEKEYAGSMDAEGRMAFYRASPEDRAKMMAGSKAKAKPEAAAAAPVAEAAPAAAAPAEEEKKPFMKTEDNKEVQKGANGTSADSGKGEGAQNAPSTSAVNNGPAGKATSENFDARRVDGQGGEPSAVANMPVQSNGYETKEAPRSDSPVQTNAGNGQANNGIAKEEVAKMINDGLAAATKSTGEMVAKAVADALAPVAQQIAAIAKGVEEAKATAQQALEAAKKTDKTMSKVVVGGDSGGDQQPAAPVQKSEGEVIGVFDTAYRRDIRKTDKAQPVRAQRRVMF